MSEAQDIEEDEVVKPTLSKCTFENGDIKLEDDGTSINSHSLIFLPC